MKIRFKGIAAAAAFLVSLFVPAFLTPVGAANVYPSLDPGWVEIYSESFEEENFGDWIPLGGEVKFEPDTRYSKNGATSLKVSNRSDTWAGPSLYVSDMLTPGEKYRFSAYVRQDNNGISDMNLVMKYNTKNDPEYKYEQIGTKSLSGTGWHKLEGTYIISPSAKDCIIYFENMTVDITYCIDLVQISGSDGTAVTSPVSESPEFSFGFEEGFDNWKILGDADMERSSNFSHSGRYSLYISERDSTKCVPTLNISHLVKSSVSYEYSAYVMFNNRAYSENYDFGLILKYTLDGEETEHILDRKTLQKGNWSRLTGEILLPEGAENVNLFIEADGTYKNSDELKTKPVAFYLDDVIILDSTIKNQREISGFITRILIIFFSAFAAAAIIMIIFHRVGVSNSILADASTDTMTRAYNRNSYEMQIAHLANCPEECKKLWVTLCDVNFLKHINDHYGHLKGDDAIIRCANVLTDTVGKKGIVYRTGGDEFVCMTKVNMHEKIKEALAFEAQQYRGYPFSVAVGTSAYSNEEDGDTPNFKLILERSDKEMYRHKEELKKEMKHMM